MKGKVPRQTGKFSQLEVGTPAQSNSSVSGALAGRLSLFILLWEVGLGVPGVPF